MPTWTVQATDDFLRANEVPLAGNWGAYAGAAGNRWNLVSNGARPSNLTTDMNAGWNARTWAQDHASACRVYVTGTSSDTGPGPMVRFIEGAHTSGYAFYSLRVSKAVTNDVVLKRVSGGAFTTLQQWTVGHVDLDIYELQVEGLGTATVLTVLRNGSTVGTYNDSGGSGLTSIGMPGIAFSSTTTFAVADEFVGSEVEKQSYYATRRRTVRR